MQKEAIHFFCSALETRNGNNNNEKWKVAQFLQQGWQSDAAEGYIPYIFIVPYASCGRLDVISVLRTRRRTIRKPLLEETQRLEWLSPPPKIRKKSYPPPCRLFIDCFNDHPPGRRQTKAVVGFWMPVHICAPMESHAPGQEVRAGVYFFRWLHRGPFVVR